MPDLSDYKCDTCDFCAESHWGGHLIVVNDSGDRSGCAHPSEHNTIFRQAGRPYYKDAWRLWTALGEGTDHPPDCNKDGTCTCLHARVRERIGWASDCVCQDCLAQCQLDLGDNEEITRDQWEWRQLYAKGRPGWDERKCPACGSANVRSVTEMLGKPCPKCGTGTFVKVGSGNVC